MIILMTSMKKAPTVILKEIIKGSKTT
jgi:hypothetical protein